jgi:hypothetical protein
MWIRHDYATIYDMDQRWLWKEKIIWFICVEEINCGVNFMWYEMIT